MIMFILLEAGIRHSCHWEFSFGKVRTANTAYNACLLIFSLSGGGSCQELHKWMHGVILLTFITNNCSFWLSPMSSEIWFKLCSWVLQLLRQGTFCPGKKITVKNVTYSTCTSHRPYHQQQKSKWLIWEMLNFSHATTIHMEREFPFGHVDLFCQNSFIAPYLSVIEKNKG